MHVEYECKDLCFLKTKRKDEDIEEEIYVRGCDC